MQSPHLESFQNARYGEWLDAASGSHTTTELEITVGGLEITFAILNLFKVMAPPAIIETWRRGHKGIATVVTIGFLGLAALSIWNITALQTIVRNDRDAAQQVEKQRLAALRDELMRTEELAAALGETRLPGVIEREMEAMRYDVRWSSAEECRDATAKASRTFCADYARLFGELSQANAVEQARLRAERLRGEIAQRITAGAVRIADPELTRIAQLTGRDADTIGWWRAVVFAVIFEMVEAFGLTLAWLVRPAAQLTKGDGAPITGGALAGISVPPPGKLPDAPSMLPSSLEIAVAEGGDEPEANELPEAAETVAEILPSKPAPEDVKLGSQAGYHAHRNPALQPAPGRLQQPAPTATSRPALRLIAPGPTTDVGKVEAVPGASAQGAIEDFVALLEPQRDGGATGGELFRAYKSMRVAHGWPEMTQTAFGRSIRVAVENRGGRKLKSRGQQVYVGVAVPHSIGCLRY